MCVSWETIIRGIITLANILFIVTPFVVEWLVLRHVWSMLTAAQTSPVIAAQLYGEYFVLITGLLSFVVITLIYKWNWGCILLIGISILYGVVGFFLYYLPVISPLSNRIFAMYLEGCDSCLGTYITLFRVYAITFAAMLFVQILLGILLYFLCVFIEECED